MKGTFIQPALPFWTALALAISFVAWDAHERAGRVLAFSELYGEAVNAPPRDANSPTGLRDARRSLVLPPLGRDAQHWIAQTQAMVAAGDARVRRVDYDNAPEGREVHWSSPFRWWLLVCAWVDHMTFGTPLPLALERSALWANPLLIAALLGGIGVVVARRWGAWPAAVLVLGLVGTFPIALNFYATNGDHHGAALSCALITVLALVVAAEPDSATNRWITLSGIVGGLGLWISAATMVPVLVGAGLGGIVAGRLARSIPATAPLPWRRWAVAGSLTSLLAYAIEYAPHHLGWRLEVNHPLYALAWLGGGELLARWAAGRSEQSVSEVEQEARRPAAARNGRSRHGQDARATPHTSAREPGSSRVQADRARARRHLAVLVAAVVALLAPLLLVIALGERVFRLRDPLLRTVHASSIAEFQSLPGFLAGSWRDSSTAGAALLVLVAFAFAAWCGWRVRDARARLQLALIAGPAITLLLLAAAQLRWWGLACTFAVLLAARGLERSSVAAGARRTPSLWRIALSGAILFGLVATAANARRAATPTESDVRQLAERDIAHRLRLRTGTDPLVVAAGPDSTTGLIYHASARGLGTLYWENRDGLAAAAELFATGDAEHARRIVARHGVTHLLLVSWDPSLDALIRAARGLPADAALPADAFGVALREGKTPPWLRPLAHRLPEHPALREERMRLFEVTEERTADVIAAHNAAFLVEIGESAAAEAMEPELATYVRSIPATATLAGLQARRRDAAGFGASLTRLLELLRDRPGLSLEDSVRVAMVLAIGGQTAPAVAVLEPAATRADERALRRLTPGTLTDMLALSDALRVPLPERLQPVAEELALPR